MEYLIVAEAYRDLEQASGRLVLIERMAELVTQTPAELLPTVCYLCQGQIAPEFAGIDLGLAEKMAIRALAAATGTEAAQVAAHVREAGDLGQAAEQLLAETAAGPARPAWTSPPWCAPCARSRRRRGRARRGASWSCWAGCSPWPPRWRPGTCCAWSPGTCGWASARRPSWTRWPRSTRAGGPSGRCWSAPTTSAATSAWSPPPWSAAGWPRWRSCTSRRATRCGPCWPSGCPTPPRSWPSWAGGARRSTSTTGSGCRRTAPRMGRSSCGPGGRKRSAPSSPTSSRCFRTGWGPARPSSKGKSWRTTRPRMNSGRSAKSCCGAVSMASTRPCRTCRWACSASSCCTPTART